MESEIISLKALLSSCYISKENPELTLSGPLWRPFPCPSLGSKNFFLFTISDKLILIPSSPNSDDLVQVYTAFNNHWESQTVKFPKDCTFHSMFKVRFNEYVFLGRIIQSSSLQPFSITISLSGNKVESSFSTKSIFSPLKVSFCLRYLDSIYLVSENKLNNPSAHFKLDLQEDSCSKLYQWTANRCLLELISTNKLSSIALNETNFSRDCLPDIFSEFLISDYDKISNLLGDTNPKKFNTLNFVNLKNNQKSIQMDLFNHSFKNINSLEDFYPFLNPTIISLSNGLTFISGGYQKNSFIATNKICLLKLTSEHDRPTKNHKEKEIPAMLFISKDNLASVENLTNIKPTNKCESFPDIIDFLLNPKTQAVTIIYISQSFLFILTIRV